MATHSTQYNGSRYCNLIVWYTFYLFKISRYHSLSSDIIKTVKIRFVPVSRRHTFKQQCSQQTICSIVIQTISTLVWKDGLNVNKALEQKQIYQILTVLWLLLLQSIFTQSSFCKTVNNFCRETWYLHLVIPILFCY